MCKKESVEACDSELSQVKRSDCQTTAASQLTDCELEGEEVEEKMMKHTMTAGSEA